MPECLFCSIVRGDASAVMVLAQDDTVAFLDHRPVFKGHTLVLPRTHHETLTDLPADALGAFFGSVQRVARAVQAGCGADGTFVAINNTISQSVPHVHVHVVPRRKGDGLRGFFWPRTTYAGPDEIEEVASRIRSALT